MVTTTDAQTPKDAVTSYTNFYEFGSEQRRRLAVRRRVQTVAVERHRRRPVRQTWQYALEDILKPHPLEERIYRHALRRRLVDGDPVGRLSARRASSSASSRREGEVRRVHDRRAVRRRCRASADAGAATGRIVEALRMDEAMHPLTILAVGLYGETLPTRTARRFGSSCRGSTDSRASSRSSRSGSSRSSRSTRGRRPTRTTTASTRT